MCKGTVCKRVDSKITLIVWLQNAHILVIRHAMHPCIALLPWSDGVAATPRRPHGAHQRSVDDAPERPTLFNVVVPARVYQKLSEQLEGWLCTVDLDLGCACAGDSVSVRACVRACLCLHAYACTCLCMNLGHVHIVHEDQVAHAKRGSEDACARVLVGCFEGGSGRETRRLRRGLVKSDIGSVAMRAGN